MKNILLGVSVATALSVWAVTATADTLKAISPRATPEGQAVESESLQRSGDHCVREAKEFTGDQSFFASSDGSVVTFEGTVAAKSGFADCMRRMGYGAGVHAGEAYWDEAD